MMAICEHTEVSGHVKPRRRHEGAQPGEVLGRRPGGARYVEKIGFGALGGSLLGDAGAARLAPRGGPCRGCPGGQKAAAKKKVATKPAKLPSAPAKYLPNIVSTSASLIVAGARATPAFSSLGQSRWGPGHRAFRHVKFGDSEEATASGFRVLRGGKPLVDGLVQRPAPWRRRAMASGSETTCARPPPLRPSPHPRPSVPTLAPASRPKSVRKFHRLRPPRRLARPLRTHPRARIPALNFLSAPLQVRLNF